jgi:invasion protein IalB
MTILLAALAAALAVDTVSGTSAKGVTAAQISAATAPVPVASFTFQKTVWDVKCKGPTTALVCSVTTNAVGKTGAVLGGSGNTLHLRLGTQAVDVGIADSPVPFDKCVIDNGSGM